MGQTEEGFVRRALLAAALLSVPAPAQQSRDVAQAARDAGNYVIEVEVAAADHNDAALGLGPELVGALVDVAGRGGATGCP